MPRIPSITENTVQSQTANQPTASSNAPAAAFGNPLGEALVTGVQTAGAIDERAALAEAEELDLQLNRQYRDLLHGENGYFNSSNREAYDNADSVQEQMAKIRQEMMSGLKNPKARDAFAKVSQSKIDRSTLDIKRHAAKNLKAWERSNYEAQTEDSLENASIYFTDSKALATQMSLGEAAIHDLAASTDMGADEKQERLETFRSSFNSAAIEGAINNNDFEKAESMLAAKRDTLEGPTAALLEAKIGKAKTAESKKQDAFNVNAVATAAVDAYGEADNARELILDEINKMPPGENRKDAQKEAMRMLDLKMKAEKERKGSQYDNADKYVASGAPLSNWIIENPQAWNEMDASMQNQLRSGAVTETDMNRWSNLMQMNDQELAELDPADHFHYLKPSDRDKLVNLVKDVKEGGTNTLTRNRNQFTKDMITNVFGKEKDWNEEEYKSVDTFHRTVEATLQSMVDNGEVIDDKKYQEVVRGLTRDGIKNGTFYGTNTINARDAYDDDVITQKQRDRIISELTKNGQPVTSDNILFLSKQIDSDGNIIKR